MFKMESYLIFKDLAIILLAAKFFGILARKLKAPMVVGMQLNTISAANTTDKSFANFFISVSPSFYLNSNIRYIKRKEVFL